MSAIHFVRLGLVGSVGSIRSQVCLQTDTSICFLVNNGIKERLLVFALFANGKPIKENRLGFWFPFRVRRISLKNLFASKRIEANLDHIRLFCIFRIPH